jgi:HTH-type transcriptional regulator, quorum sensing regulator NprR
LEGLGQIIKLYRKKNDISQSELAKGICSISYLSKIENEKIESSSEVANLLLNRLNYSNSVESIEQKSSHYYNKLHDFNYQLFKMPSSALKIKQDILNTIETASTLYKPNIRVFAVILKLRLYLILEKSNEAERIIEELNVASEQMEPKNLFFFTIYKSQFYLNESKVSLAESNINLCLQQVETIKLDSWAVGYLYYLKSLISNSIYQTFQSMHYAEKALSVFQEEFYLHRCADCYLLLAIGYRRISEPNKALELLQKCEKLIGENNFKVIGKILHNQALIYEQLGELDKTIELLNRSIDSKKKAKDHSYLFTLLVLLKTYFRNCSYNLFKDGLSQFDLPIRDKVLQLEFQLLQELCCGLKQMEKFNEKEYKKNLTKLSELRSKKIVGEYHKWCGSLFYQNGQYKKASQYFLNAFNLYDEFT